MIVLRHCQSEFNRLFSATRRDPGIPDPPLSLHGKQQAENLVTALKDYHFSRVIVSPFTRTLQTAYPLCKARGILPEIHPLVRERAAFSCDVGSPPSLLASQWPDIDFTQLEETWWTQGIEPEAAVDQRAELFRKEMDSLNDHKDTLVVSHWGFLFALTGESMENAQWLEMPSFQGNLPSDAA
ncbi:MAG: histidine phosphatase family protein [Acetobacter sp.]|nr:histidine phosphatase family protein [Acetobacter sp.]